MTSTIPGTAEDVSSALKIILVRLDRPCTVVVLRGDVDAYSGPALSETLSRVIASREGTVVVDLANVRFIDSVGVHALKVAHDLLSRQGRSLTIRSPSTTAAKILVVFGLSDLIDATDVSPAPSITLVEGGAGTT
jgi:anti-sigma B factor antagonist